MDEVKKEEGKKKPARLNHTQFYNLCGWLQSNAERLMKEKPTYTGAARQAAAHLGLDVSDSTLKEAMGVTNVKWETPALGGPMTKVTAKELMRRIQESEDRIKRLEAEAAWTRALVHNLYHELGTKPPIGYQIPPKDAVLSVLKDRGANNISRVATSHQ
jgi:hypothetical protein